MIHPAFQYRKGNNLLASEALMLYQYQFERLENIKVDLLITKVRLLAETNLSKKATLLKRQADIKEEISVLEDSIELSLKCWKILTGNKENN